MFTHSAWGLGIAWLIFASMMRCGGPFSLLLEAKMWDVLAKLTFSAYLIHPIVVRACARARARDAR